MATRIFNMADNWNNGATLFHAIKMSVTRTASAAGSRLLELLTNNVSQFAVDPVDGVTVGTPTLGPMGPGRVNVAGGYYVNGVPLLGQVIGSGSFYVFNDPANGLVLKAITGTDLPAAQNNALGAVKAKPVVAGQVLIGLDETGAFLTGSGGGGGSGRDFLTANRAYFVRPDGSDSNTGLGNTAGGAFLTIQKAIDTACALDLSTFGVQINVTAGTYNVSTGLPGMTLKSYIGAGPISIVGNIASPQNVIVNVTNNDVILARSILGAYNIAGFTLKANTFGYDVLRANGGSTTLTLQDIRYDTALVHVFADYGAQVFLTGTQTIIGDANIHYQFTNKGIIQDVGKTVTLVGTRAFGYFAYGQFDGMLDVTGTSYPGSAATGQKFTNRSQAMIVTGNGNLNLFPGNIPGDTWDGGYF